MTEPKVIEGIEAGPDATEDDQINGGDPLPEPVGPDVDETDLGLVDPAEDDK